MRWPPSTRLLYLGLRSCADPRGCGDASPIELAEKIFPHDYKAAPFATFVKIQEGLTTLLESGRIVIHSSPVNGITYQLTKRRRHQPEAAK